MNSAEKIRSEIRNLAQMADRLAEYKRQKGSLIVLMEEGKIVHLTSDEYLEAVYESRKKKADEAAKDKDQNPSTSE